MESSEDGGFIREETESDPEESGPDGDEQENADENGSANLFDDGTETGISPQSSTRKSRAQWVVLGTYSKKNDLTIYETNRRTSIHGRNENCYCRYDHIG